MSQSAPLNLASVDPAVWRVIVKDTPYGPYTLGQLQGFVAEGRLAPGSLVAHGDGGQLIRAKEVPELGKAFSLYLRAHPPGRRDTPSSFNYIVAARLKTIPETDFILALNALGKFSTVLPGLWALHSSAKLPVLQKTLREAVGVQDQVLIVNATTDRLGWFNLGADADVHLRSVWDTGAKSS